MARTKWLWVLAAFITVGTLVYQRMTGPTYPLRGRVAIGGQTFRLKLARSQGGTAGQRVSLVIPDTAVHGMVQWRRFPTNDQWNEAALARLGDTLEVVLPHQPPAGKLAYQLHLTSGTERVVYPAEPIVTRFKGDISALVIIPHLICMFGGLFLLVLAGIGAMVNDGKYPRQARLGTALFGLGGFLFGPWMQHQAFGPWWAGFPFGGDMTDNKTAVAMLAWLVALWMLRGGKQARRAVITAAVVTLAVFLIPHSVFGSQLDWSKVEAPAR